MDKETYKLLSRLQKDGFIHDNPLNDVPPAILGLAKDGLLNEVELKGPSRGTAYVVSEKGREALALSRWRIFIWLRDHLDTILTSVITTVATMLAAKWLGALLEK